MPLQKKNDLKKKGGKHHSQTPDVPVSPVHSESNDKIDILNDEEIQSYAIKQLELEKIRKGLTAKQPETKSSKKLQVNVKRQLEIRKQTPQKDTVVVAKAIAETNLKDVDYSGPAGPRYTEEGHIVEYSLVGPVEDFIKEAVQREQLTTNSPAATIITPRSIDGSMAMYERPEPIPPHLTKFRYDQNKALNRWHQHLKSRKINQNTIAKKLDRNVRDLVMNANQHSMMNAKNETRKLIEYVTPFYDNSTTLPSVNGCEFWKFPQQMGGEDGIATTLTRTEQGFPFYYEHIRQPLSILKETGLVNAGEKISKPNARNFENIGYLKRKKFAMGDLINEIHPHEPNLENLEVRHRKVKLHNPENHIENIPTGTTYNSNFHTPHPAHGYNSFDSSELNSSPEVISPLQERKSLPPEPTIAMEPAPLDNNRVARGSGRRGKNSARSSGASGSGKSPTSKEIPDSVRMQMSLEEFPDDPNLTKFYDGPSVKLNEEVASWNGSSSDRLGETGLEVRMTFNSAINRRDEMQLRIENCGTTSMSFQWNKIPTPPKFSIIQKDEVQRFYFNIGDGVILPGDVIMLPFTFKSPNAGIFTELWRFSTRPVVMGGASLHIILKGVATQELDHVNMKEICRQIDVRLDKCEASSIVNRMLTDLIRGIRTPERCPSPIESHITEEELFLEKNVGMFYNFEGVAELRQIYDECLQLEDSTEVAVPQWSLSVGDLRDVIRHSSVNCDVTESLLRRVNDIITSKLCAKLIEPPTNINYNACMTSLQMFLDEMSSCSFYLKSINQVPSGNDGNESTTSFVAINNKSSNTNGKAKTPKTEKQRKSVKLVQPTKNKEVKPVDENTGYDVTNPISVTSYNSADDAIVENYDKYKEKFLAMTRELLIETLEKIFGLFEENSQC